MSFAYWIVQSGDLGRATSWSTGLVPDGQTSLLIGAGGAATLNAQYRQDRQVSCASLVVTSEASLGMAGYRYAVPGGWAENPSVLTCGYLYNGGTITLAESVYVKGGAVRNDGTILVAAASRNVLIASDFDNHGTLSVGKLATLTLSSVENLVSGVLSGGEWSVSGTGSQLTLDGSTITELAANTTVTLASDGSSIFAGDSAIDATLTKIDAGATLAILDGRDYSAQPLQLDGTLQLGGGTFSAGALTVSSSGSIAGYGTIAGAANFAGEIMTVADQSRHPLALTITGSLLLDGGDVSGQGTLVNSGLLLLQNSAVASRTLENDATIIATGDTTIAAKLVNDGTVSFGGQTLTLANAVSGHGSLHLTGSGTLHVAGAVGAGQTVALDGHGVLQIDKAGAFKAGITGFDAGDTIDLRNLAWHEGYTIGWNAKSDRLTISDGTNSVRLHIDGDFVSANFQLGDDGRGGTALTFESADANPTAHAPFSLDGSHIHALPILEIAHFL